jgi:hypothetical protein
MDDEIPSYEDFVCEVKTVMCNLRKWLLDAEARITDLEEKAQVLGGDFIRVTDVSEY